MDKSGQHIIVKQVVEVTLPATADGFVWQQKLGGVFGSNFCIAVEQLFDKFCRPDVFIQIKSIEIQIDNLTPGNFEKEIVGHVISALETKLKEYFSTSSEMDGRYVLNDAVPEDKVSLQSRIKQDNSDSNKNSSKEIFIRKSIREYTFDEWLLFLEHGSFSVTNSKESDEPVQLEVLSFLASETSALEKLKGLLLTNTIALKRLIVQYPDKFLKSILETVYAQNQEQQIKVLEEWYALRKYVQNTIIEKNEDSADFINKLKYLRYHFWKFMLLYSIKSGTNYDSTKIHTCFFNQYFHLTERQILIQFIQNTHIKQKKQFSILSEIIQGKDEKQSATDLLNDKRNKNNLLTKLSDKIPIEKELGKGPESESENEFLMKEKKIQSEIGTNIQNQTDTLPSDISDDLAKEETKFRNESDIVEEIIKSDTVINPLIFDTDTKNKPEFKGLSQEINSMYVENAGVILLHPFLKNFFNKLELLTDSVFKDEEARHKAVHLIQYLATGKTELPEYEMALPKLVCGLAFGKPLERYIPISIEEMAESENLLKAAIEHWKVLGNTSPDGLREGFLQRNGKLEKRQQGWFLLVEHKSIDILLGRLPWGIGMIKLPWMEELLHVEWT